MVLALVGCRGTPSQRSSDVGFSAEVASVSTTSGSGDDILVGEPITLTLRVTNTSSAPQRLDFSGDIAAFTVRSSLSNQVVWESSHASGGSTSHLLFVPGETKTFSVVWDQTDGGGAAVAPGVYLIAARLLARGAPLGLSADPGEAMITASAGG
jgi:hypothetical protein